MNMTSIIPPANIAPQFQAFMASARIPTVLTSVQRDVVNYSIPVDGVLTSRLFPLIVRKGTLEDVQAIYGPEADGRLFEDTDLYIEWRRLQRVTNDVARDVRKASELEIRNKWLSVQAFDTMNAGRRSRGGSTTDGITLSSHFLVSGLYYAELDSPEDKGYSISGLLLAAQTLENTEALWMTSAMVCELASEVSLAAGDEDEAAGISANAAAAWQESIEDYSDPLSLGIRIARGLYHARVSGSNGVTAKLLHASADYNAEYGRPAEAALDLLRLVSIKLIGMDADAVELGAIADHLWSAYTLIGDADGSEDLAVGVAEFALSAERAAANI